MMESAVGVARRRPLVKSLPGSLSASTSSETDSIDRSPSPALAWLGLIQATRSIFSLGRLFFEETSKLFHVHFAADWNLLYGFLPEAERYSDLFVDTPDYELCRSDIWVRFRRIFSSTGSARSYWSVKATTEAFSPDTKKYISYKEEKFDHAEAVFNYLKTTFPLLTASKHTNLFSYASFVLASYNAVRHSGLDNGRKIYMDTVQLSYSDYYILGTVEVAATPNSLDEVLETFHSLPSKAIEAFRRQNPQHWKLFGELYPECRLRLTFGVPDETSVAHFSEPPFESMGHLFQSFPLLLSQVPFFAPSQHLSGMDADDDDDSEDGDSEDDEKTEEDKLYAEVDAAINEGLAMCKASAGGVTVTYASDFCVHEDARKLALPGRILIRSADLDAAKRISNQLSNLFPSLAPYFVVKPVDSRWSPVADEYAGTCTLEATNTAGKLMHTSLGFVYQRKGEYYGATVAHGCSLDSDVEIKVRASGGSATSFNNGSLRASVVSHDVNFDLAILQLKGFVAFSDSLGIQFRNFKLLDYDQSRAHAVDVFKKEYGTSGFQSFGIRTVSLLDYYKCDDQVFKGGAQQFVIHFTGYAQKGDSGSSLVALKGPTVCGLLKGGYVFKNPSGQLVVEVHAVPRWQFPARLRKVKHVMVPYLSWGLVHSNDGPEAQPAQSAASSSTAGRSSSSSDNNNNDDDDGRNSSRSSSRSSSSCFGVSSS